MRLRGLRFKSGPGWAKSLATIEEHSTPLEQATTQSLEALKAYSAARNTVFARGFAAAIPHLQRAIAIDPQFAMAHAHLGFFYWNMGQTDLAMEHTLKAYELAGSRQRPGKVLYLVSLRPASDGKLAEGIGDYRGVGANLSP